jgi:hypothetical protein
VTKVNGAGFAVKSLRNIAYPLNATVLGASNQSDLNQVFKTPKETTEALKHRFDGLPIHKLCYYQSYYKADDVYKQLKAAIVLGARKKRALDGNEVDPTGDQQDCLGMAPLYLYILACSTVPRKELYELIVEHCPRNLIARDKWGAMPVL